MSWILILGRVWIFRTDFRFLDRIKIWGRFGIRGPSGFRLETFQTGVGFRTDLGFGSVLGSGSGPFLDQIFILGQNWISDQRLV